MVDLCLCIRQKSAPKNHIFLACLFFFGYVEATVRRTAFHDKWRWASTFGGLEAIAGGRGFNFIKQAWHGLVFSNQGYFFWQEAPGRTASMINVVLRRWLSILTAIPSR